MDKLFFGFALADSMFDDGNISRKTLTDTQVDILLENAEAAGRLVSCCNPSHVATINAMRQRFGINVGIPETPPRVKLAHGDSVIVMGVRGLPRLTDRHEYTDVEIAGASFTFALYSYSA